MKKGYSAPEANIIDFQALENIALIEERDNGGVTGNLSATPGTGDYEGGY